MKRICTECGNWHNLVLLCRLTGTVELELDKCNDCFFYHAKSILAGKMVINIPENEEEMDGSFLKKQVVTLAPLEKDES